MVAASLRGPSAGGTEPWHVDLFAEHQEVAAFWRAAWPTRNPDDQPERLNASAIAVFGASTSAYNDRYALDAKPHGGPANWPVDYAVVDASFAAMLFQLAATNSGLGSWFFGFDVANYRATFATPSETVLVGAVAVGVPDAGSAKRRVRPASDFVRRPAQAAAE
jgi:nitroreductase